MTHINLTTEIAAGIEITFDLARDVETHKLSMQRSNEIAVAGRMAGLCEAGDTITWPTHFWIRQKLTVEITKMRRPFFFEDKMLSGAFKSMRHEHHFSYETGKTIMTDHFEYEVPFGILGKVFDQVILKDYMTRLLTMRNDIIKMLAEKQGHPAFFTSMLVLTVSL
jgi:ligand-binding SRPBCC domain-containing protein